MGGIKINTEKKKIVESQLKTVYGNFELLNKDSIDITNNAIYKVKGKVEKMEGNEYYHIFHPVHKTEFVALFMNADGHISLIKTKGNEFIITFAVSYKDGGNIVYHDRWFN